MKKLCIPLGILLVLAFIITGCGGSTPTTSAPPAQTTTSAPPTTTTSAPTTAKPTSSAPVSTAPNATTSTAAPTGINKYGGTLHIIEPTTPIGPLGTEWETGDQEAEQYVMERLLSEQLDGSMGPALATSWDINTSPDSPSITFHLRQGVKFSDGSDFNAKVVQWNLDIFKNPGKYVPGDVPVYGSTTNYWKSFDVLDDYTIRVNYTQYRNTFLRAYENYFMTSPTAFEKNGIDWMRTHMVGTGPFMQTDYKRDVAVTTVKNPNFWDAGKPYLDGVQLIYIVDELTRVAMFKSGGAEELSAGPKLAALQFQNQGYNILSRVGGPFALIPDSMNSDSPWSNLKVRQAVDYALDRESLAKAFGYGYGVPAYQMADPNSKAYDPSLKNYPYDVGKAKQLLADAGYPNGFKSTIIANPIGLDKDVVVAVQAQLAKIGINTDLQFPQPAEYSPINVGPWHNALLYTPIADWSNYNTTLNVYFAEPGSFVFHSLKKPDGWAALYNKSLTTPSPDPAILKEVSDAFYNDATIIPLFYSANVYVLSPKVKDSGLTTLGTVMRWTLPDTWLSK